MRRSGAAFGAAAGWAAGAGAGFLLSLATTTDGCMTFVI